MTGDDGTLTHGLLSQAEYRRQLTELAHDDTPTLVGTVVPSPHYGLHILTAAWMLNEKEAGWETDPRQCHLMDSYLKTGRRAAGRPNPVGSLPWAEPYQDVVKAAAGLLELGREARIARLNDGGAA